MNDVKVYTDQAVGFCKRKWEQAGVAVGLALVGIGSASAQSAGFDATSITTKITENAATATLIIGAFILAVWGLRSMGLLKGRG
jgi:protein-S-isoprenylcysteine O-methyltransferase Ste14